MSYSLWQLMRDAYLELGQLQVASATGGSATTVVDTGLVGTGNDDDWNKGAVIILKTTDAASPQGKFAVVSDYVDSSGTLTIDTVTDAVGAGDIYGLASEYFPLYQMVEIANLALQNLGDLSLVDTSTLDTADNQTEYAASVAWKRRPPYRIDIQTNINDADDNRWLRLDAWEYIPAAAGSTGLIIFRHQPPAARDLRIWYVDQHPRVEDYDDVINEAIHPSLAVAAVTEKALTWQLSRLQGQDDFMIQRLNDAKVEMQRQMRKNPVWRAPKEAHRLSLATRHYKSDQYTGTVRL